MPVDAGPEEAEERYDLIVVGGGVHGVMLALMAAEHGRRALLLERDRIGQATSAAWFGILHGGLRYLQSLDIPRLRSSMIARRWFQQAFPDLVRPLPFLMPLYGQGLKRPEVFRLAFLADAALTADRNRNVPEAARLTRGRVLGTGSVLDMFPGARLEGLRGGALWNEIVVPDTRELMAALAARAALAGAVIQEETEVTGVHSAGDRVTGVTARGTAAGQSLRYDAPVVINAAGPWSGTLARTLDARTRTLFHATLGFNLLLDRPPPAPVGLSLSPPGRDGPMLFLYPRGGQTFAGTWYAPHSGPPDKAYPDRDSIRAFLVALEAALPGFGATEADIVETTSGLLPATAPGTVDLAQSDLIYDHARHGGPAGLFSLAGIKYTTAPQGACRVLAQAGLLRRSKILRKILGRT